MDTIRGPGAGSGGGTGRFRAVLVGVALGAVLLAGACGGAGVATTDQGSQSVAAQYPPQSYGGAYQGGSATGDTQEGAAFAQWVLQQDPQHQLITDAVVRGDQNLGVKVQPTATKGDVQQLLVALTQGMAKTFPGKPLTVVAFYQSGQKLAQANYDPSSGQVAVQFTS